MGNTSFLRIFFGAPAGDNPADIIHIKYIPSLEVMCYRGGQQSTTAFPSFRSSSRSKNSSSHTINDNSATSGVESIEASSSVNCSFTPADHRHHKSLLHQQQVCLCCMSLYSHKIMTITLITGNMPLLTFCFHTRYSAVTIFLDSCLTSILIPASVILISIFQF